MDSKVAAIAISIPIIGILGIVTMIIMLRKFQNEERMSMIEKGMQIPESKPFSFGSSGSLTYGCLAVGAGLGLLIGEFLISQFNISDTVYFALLLMGGGAGLLASYKIQDKKEKGV